jgi:hypothetical protein
MESAHCGKCAKIDKLSYKIRARAIGVNKVASLEKLKNFVKK